MSENQATRSWWLLIHQLPPKPDYFRVKIGRRLQRLGSVAVKSSVYALPYNDETHEDLQWLLREIQEGGGEASLCEARFTDGLSDAQLVALFQGARDADYRELVDDGRKALASFGADGSPDAAVRTRAEADLTRLKRRLHEISSIDFFKAPERASADEVLGALERRVEGTAQTPAEVDMMKTAPTKLVGRTWVTRKNVHVDRMASAWLIRRFVDPKAKFKLVAAKGYAPKKGELRFDMFEAEFTHEGDRCTFEVLLERLGIDDRALRPIAEIVHDIDIKDGKFGRDEAQGVAMLINGIAVAHARDEDRLERSAAAFDDLYELFKRKRGK